MPHQCLKCGSLFPEGTTTILRGCPDCRGTRFFYTSEPLPESERERLLRQAEQDLPSLLRQVLADLPHESRSEPKTPARPVPAPAPEAAPRPQGVLLPGNKLLIKLPKQIKSRARRAVVQWDYEVAPAEPAPPPATVPRAAPSNATPSPPIPPSPAPAPRPLGSTVVEGEKAPGGHRPETVLIPEPGAYEIDVKRLLESSPIIVQRDGTYLLHLPSIFEGQRRPPP